MTTQSQKREVTRIFRAADVVPTSINVAERTVDVVWTTGQRVLRYSWFDGPWFEELSTDPKHVRMERLESGRAPVLLQHNSWNPDAHQGVVVTASLTGGQGTATLRFLKGDPDADKTWNKIEQRVLTSVSVGYAVHKMEKIEDGDETIPIYRATDWEPHEISPVSIPADIGAHVRSGDAETRNAPTNICEIITHTRAVQAHHQEHRSMGKDEKKGATDATATDAATVAADEKRQAEIETAAKAATEAERKRSEDIRTLVKRHGLADDFATSLVVKGVSLAKAREAVLDALVEREKTTDTANHVVITGGADVTDKQRLADSSWLIERTGFSDTVAKAKGKPAFERAFRGGVVVDPGASRGLTLLDMARAFLERNKVRTAGMTKMELAGRALSFRSGLQGTGDFPVLFEDALRKILLASYATQSDTWRLFCGTDTVPDFRPSPRYRTGEMGGTLDRLNEHGEYKNKAIPDGARTDISTESRGNMIGLTREVIINDDMGALANVAASFGRLAGRSIEVDVYALLAQNAGLGPVMADGKTFFHADHGNIGAGSALGIAGLGADKRLMRRQKDISGADYIDLRPQTLLLSDVLEDDANIFNTSEFDPKDNNFRKPNTVRGLFSTIVGTPRLDGTTRRYLFADPSGGAIPIKVVFLEGQGEAPVMETQEGWRTDGTEWKIRSDFKVVPFDPKGAVTNAGA